MPDCIYVPCLCAVPNVGKKEGIKALELELQKAVSWPGHTHWFWAAASLEMLLEELAVESSGASNTCIFAAACASLGPQSSMCRHISQFCGVLSGTFMDFLKGSGDCCQAEQYLYADK